MRSARSIPALVVPLAACADHAPAPPVSVLWCTGCAGEAPALAATEGVEPHPAGPPFRGKATRDTAEVTVAPIPLDTSRILAIEVGATLSRTGWLSLAFQAGGRWEDASGLVSAAVAGQAMVHRFDPRLIPSFRQPLERLRIDVDAGAGTQVEIRFVRILGVDDGGT